MKLLTRDWLFMHESPVEAGLGAREKLGKAACDKIPGKLERTNKKAGSHTSWSEFPP